MTSLANHTHEARWLAVLGILSVVLLTLVARRARADAARVLHLVSADAATEARLAAELRALDLAVEKRTQLPPAQSLTEWAAAMGKAGTLQVVASGTLELCTLSRATAPRCQRVAIDRATGWGAPATAALEAFRAALSELPVSPAEREEVGEVSARLGLQAAAAVAYSAGGFRVRPELQCGLRYEPWSFLALSVSGGVDPGEARVRAVEGSAYIRAARLALIADYQRLVRRATFSFGVGATYAHFWIHARASGAGLATRDSTPSAWGPQLHVGLALPVHARLRVRADFALGLATPRLRIFFDQREVAQWGVPFGSLSLGLEIGLWQQRVRRSAPSRSNAQR